MQLDDAILEELKRAGPGTEKEISDRLSGRLYAAFQRLIDAEKIKHDALSSPHKENVYGLPWQQLFPTPPTIGLPRI
jgi:hypothetical protein